MACSFTTGELTHVGFWQTLSDHENKTQLEKKNERRISAHHQTAGLFVHFSCLSEKERREDLDSGYIYLKFTSLHLKELVLTDRPLRQCQSMKGMDEQSDLIVLTLELKEQKYLWQQKT